MTFDEIVEEAVLDHLNNTVLGSGPWEPDVDFDRKTVTVRLTFDQVMTLPTAPGVLTDPRLLAMLREQS